MYFCTTSSYVKSNICFATADDIEGPYHYEDTFLYSGYSLSLIHIYANENYSEFIGKELVKITRRMFPLSYKKEDTCIAGLSMGGYGAIRNGLKYHDTFGYIAGLSSAMILEKMGIADEDVYKRQAVMEYCHSQCFFISHKCADALSVAGLCMRSSAICKCKRTRILFIK